MSNTILTSSKILRESLRVLHQKLNFVGNITRSYDDQYAKQGAKIGDTVNVRLPNEYVVRTGTNMSAQDTTETSVPLQVNTMKGVDLTFTSQELTLSLDDFSERIINPAMSVLAANIEADALNMYKDVYNLVDQDATAFSWNTILNGRKTLNDNLTPMDNQRSCLLSTASSVKLVDALKGLFQDSGEISKQYKEGKMGRSASFDFYENTLLVPHTTGTAVKATTGTINGAITTNGSTSGTLGGTSGSWKKGDVFTVVGCYRVHPETKVSTGVLQQFVMTADNAGGAVAFSFAPAIYTSGGKQNVVAAGMANGAALVKVGAGNAEQLGADLVFHKNAFAFATADLLLPSGVDFAAREVMDGISMSIVRDFAISDRSFPCRIDVLYGYKAIRPQLAARLHADG